mmetsp:Transcript_18912/g.31573  ORF Transcript_18912/g.31573 Transcript_18912/m.31573 type:complete len:168 (-) Transcript_18912:871-1374(-)
MISVERMIDDHVLFGILPGTIHESGRAPLNPLRPTILSQIHDEVIYDVPLEKMPIGEESYSDDHHVQQFVSLLEEGLQNVTRSDLGLDVPLLVNITIGENWGNMVPFNRSKVGSSPDTYYDSKEGKRSGVFEAIPQPLDSTGDHKESADSGMSSRESTFKSDRKSID